MFPRSYHELINGLNYIICLYDAFELTYYIPHTDA